MIRLEDVTVVFDGHRALDGVSLHVPEGSTCGLVGEGGAGKSLVLKAICGLVRPESGRISVGADVVTDLSETALMGVRARIGMVFQNYALFDYLSVGDNLAFPLRQLGGYTPETVAARVRRRLEQVHLTEAAHLMPAELSGGMKKRVCLARATIHDPPILLCDDPTAGLDPVTAHRIFRLLEQLQRETRATAIIVSHEVAYLKGICDRFVRLDHGRTADPAAFLGAA